MIKENPKFKEFKISFDNICGSDPFESIFGEGSYKSLNIYIYIYYLWNSLRIYRFNEW